MVVELFRVCDNIEPRRRGMKNRIEEESLERDQGPSVPQIEMTRTTTVEIVLQLISILDLSQAR